MTVEQVKEMVQFAKDNNLSYKVNLESDRIVIGYSDAVRENLGIVHPNPVWLDDKEELWALLSTDVQFFKSQAPAALTRIPYERIEYIEFYGNIAEMIDAINASDLPSDDKEAFKKAVARF